MQNNQNEIAKQCGVQPPDISIPEIGNDPNFVFVNDPSFVSLNLYDIDGNNVIVNSWIECAHYVKGGWSTILNQNIPGDKYIVFICGSLIIFYYVLKIFKKKKVHENK
jgi:hypothetical protein